MNEGTTANQATNVDVDLPLLGEARRLLEDFGFTVVTADLSPARLPWLLAENDLFALGVVATRTLDDLIALEAHATPVLAERIRGAGPKRWDAYLVLLAREGREARGTRAVRNLQYDTSLLRRVVNLGVSADEESIRRALGPFLPLPIPLGQLLGSGVGDLVDELVLQGIDRDRALEAVRGYQALESA
jgi:hypothetical protein